MAGNPSLPGNQLDVSMLPQFQDSMAHTGAVPGALDTPAASAQLTGDARASFIQNLRSQQAATGAGVPQYTPGAPSNLGTTPAPGFQTIDPNASGFNQWDASQRNDTALQGVIGKAQSDVGANYGPISDVGNWLFGAGGTPAEYAAKKQANTLIGSNAMHDYLAQFPSMAHEMQANPMAFAQRVGPMMEAASAKPATPGVHTGVGADGMPYNKTDTNPALTDAFAAAHGVGRDAAHAGLETGQYSLPEFLNAVRGTSRVAMKNMWEMQHYLDPKAQATATALAQSQQAALNEQQANASTGAKTTAAGDLYHKLLLQLATGMPQ